MRLPLIAALIALPVIATAADDPLDKVIDARRAYFKLIGANTGVLGGMAKGNIDYDAAAATQAASNLAAMAAYDASPHFAPGTSNADKPGKTRALPKIWEDMPGVGAKLTDFKNAVANLQDKAGAGREALGSAMGQLGGSCKGCHDDYRAKEF